MKKSIHCFIKKTVALLTVLLVSVYTFAAPVVVDISITKSSGVNYKTTITSVTKTSGKYTIDLTGSDEKVTKSNALLATCATPVLSPASGTYPTGQTVTVTMTSATSGATIYYTNNGNTPSSTYGYKYTAPFTVSSNKTIKAIAYLSGYTKSAVVTETYAFATPAATPTFSPSPGTYTSIQNVTISTATSSATIRYTTDGSTPNLTSTTYSSPIPVSVPTTIKAIAVKSGYANSAIASGLYTVLLPVAAPTFAPAAGTYNITQNVVITSTLSASIYYTTDGTPPTTSSTLYSGSVSIDINKTLKAFAVKSGMSDSPVTTGVYVIKCANPTFNLAAGTYTTFQTVSLSCNTSGASIRYTTDGSDPSPSTGSVYSAPIAVNATTLIKAIAYKTGATSSDIASSNYVISLLKVSNPVLSPSQGTYNTYQNVAITCPTNGTTIMYTTDGSDATPSNGTIYTTPIAVEASTVIKTIAFKYGMANSDLVTGSYVIQLLPVDAPVYNPQAGAYEDNLTVTIGTTTAGCTIHYTTDGSTPTEIDGAEYTAPVTINTNTNFRALAFKHGMHDSPVSESNCIIKVAKPQFSPAPGNYSTFQSVTLSSTTSGATIRYTTDGTAPSHTNGTVYSTAIAVNATTTIRAIAYKTGKTDSDIATGTYTITLLKVATPTFSPASGTYNTYQNVSLSCSTSGVTIKYTTDGSAPSQINGTVYSSAIPIQVTTNLKAIAYKNGMTDSDVAASTYTIQLLNVAAPTFTPAAGTYNTAQNVAIASTTYGASVYYTTDGNPPTTLSSLYSAVISVSANTTLNAIAVKSGMNNSSVTSASYVINCATPVLSPVGDTYGTPQSVTMTTATSAASIYYTADGNPPSTSSTLYAGTVAVGASSTLKAIAVKSGMGNSGIATEAYIILAPIVAPIFTPAAGPYNSAQSVAITSSVSDASIRYTTDGSTPSNVAGTVYTIPVPISINTILKAIAYKNGMTNSPVTSGGYVINCATPVLTPATGSYTSTQSVTITSATSDAAIYYTTDGNPPTGSSTLYNGAISVGTNMTIKAIAIKTEMGNSDVSSETYTIKLPVTAPTFTPAAGTYYAVQSVTIGTTTSGADIYYTLDESAPTTNSPHYIGAVSVGANLTLKAIAEKEGMSPSPVTSGNYIILLPADAPQFSPVAGNYTSAQSVTITSTTTGGDARIYYTTNGTDPTASSTLYSVPVSIDLTKTLKAITVKTGMSDSPITSGKFVILPVANAPTFSPTPATYIGSQNVTIATTSAGAIIRYTTDGITTPSETVGTEYTGPVTIGVNTTFKAIAYGTAYAKSAVTSVVYNIKVATPILSVLAGTYTVPQSLSITCSTADAKIYYTIDGTTVPSATNGVLYTNEISIDVTTNVKVIAIKAEMTDSDPVNPNYVINLGKVVTPVFTPAAGIYAGSQSVTITSETTNATIVYTLDGNAPSRINGTTYSGPVTISANSTLKAFAYKTNMIDSDVASGDYKIKPAVITFTPAPGNYTTVQSIVLACITPDVTIKYTIDGNAPSRTNGTEYTVAIVLSSNITLKAIAYKTGLEDGDIASGDYTFQLAKVANPIFSPAPGSYTTPKAIKLSSTTTDATIRYTIDGSAPSKTEGTVYTDSISISSTTTINAIAYKFGFDDSEVVSGTYTIHLGPADTDGDGIPDNVDDYPTDPLRASNHYYPGSGFGSLAFEDNWPFRADYDMNDMVIDYQFNQVTNASNKVVEIKAKIVLRAMGASFHNGFGIEFPVLPSQVSSCVATLENGSPFPDRSLVSIDPVTGLENNQAKAVVILFDDGYKVLPQPYSGTGVNTTPSIPFVTPVTINLVITFTTPISIGVFTDPVYNPFIFTNKTRSTEIHLPNYPPTSLVNTGLFNTGEDNSNLSTHQYYKTSNNLPWALNIFEGYNYPIEKVSIVNAFLHFAEWAGSAGVLFPDWYKDLPGYRNTDNIYNQH